VTSLATLARANRLQVRRTSCYQPKPNFIATEMMARNLRLYTDNWYHQVTPSSLRVCRQQATIITRRSLVVGHTGGSVHWWVRWVTGRKTDKCWPHVSSAKTSRASNEQRCNKRTTNMCDIRRQPETNHTNRRWCVHTKKCQLASKKRSTECASCIGNVK